MRVRANEREVTLSHSIYTHAFDHSNLLMKVNRTELNNFPRGRKHWNYNNLFLVTKLDFLKGFSGKNLEKKTA